MFLVRFCVDPVVRKRLKAAKFVHSNNPSVSDVKPVAPPVTISSSSEIVDLSSDADGDAVTTEKVVEEIVEIVIPPFNPSPLTTSSRSTLSPSVTNFNQKKRKDVRQSSCIDEP